MSHKLEHYDEFESILADYHISDEGKELLKDVRLVLLTSPSSSGKTSLIKELVETGAYEKMVSNTTRPKRQNEGIWEEDGNQYWFKTETQMLNDLRDGVMLEAEIIHGIQVSGVSLEEVKKAKDHGKIAVNELDFRVDIVRDAKPDTEVLFIAPPDHETWMQRFENRGEITQDEYVNRLKTAEKMYEAALNRDYYKIVINEHLSESVEKIRRIVEQDGYTEQEHDEGREIVWELLNKVKQLLYS